MRSLRQHAIATLLLSLASVGPAMLSAPGQEKSVRPGINKPFELTLDVPKESVAEVANGT